MEANADDGTLLGTTTFVGTAGLVGAAVGVEADTPAGDGAALLAVAGVASVAAGVGATVSGAISA